VPGESKHDLALLLRQADRRVTARLSALLAAQGSSVEQWHVLSSLSDGAGRAMSEIGSVVMVPPPSMSKLVDGMVALNLVHRRVDDRDRRRVLVYLTRRGRSLHRELAAVVEQHEAELRALYGASGMNDLVAHLDALVETLDSAPSTAPVVPAPA
jgi:DNA-binding MarR family transcriptional regulator